MTLHQAKMALCGLKMGMRLHTKRHESDATSYGIRFMERGSKFFTSVTPEQIEQATDIAQLLPSEVQRAD